MEPRNKQNLQTFVHGNKGNAQGCPSPMMISSRRQMADNARVDVPTTKLESGARTKPPGHYQSTKGDHESSHYSVESTIAATAMTAEDSRGKFYEPGKLARLTHTEIANDRAGRGKPKDVFDRDTEYPDDMSTTSFNVDFVRNRFEEVIDSQAIDASSSQASQDGSGSGDEESLADSQDDEQAGRRRGYATSHGLGSREGLASTLSNPRDIPAQMERMGNVGLAHGIVNPSSSKFTAVTEKGHDETESHGDEDDGDDGSEHVSINFQQPARQRTQNTLYTVVKRTRSKGNQSQNPRSLSHTSEHHQNGPRTRRQQSGRPRRTSNPALSNTPFSIQRKVQNNPSSITSTSPVAYEAVADDSHELRKEAQAAPDKLPLGSDYDEAQLSKMSYGDLNSESFDFNPCNMQSKGPEILTSKDLSEKLTAIAKLSHLSEKQRFEKQAAFFSSLNIDQYEECGELIIDHFANALKRVAQLRREKRKLALQFEQEVARREEAVRGRAEEIARNMAMLRKSGEDVMRGKVV